MATQVLLMTDVKDLGQEGDVVSVSDGFARNYLMPRKLAAPVTAATKRRLSKIQRERDEKEKTTLTAYRELANRLASVSCTIAVKTGGGEKLYGSVGAADIAKALQDQGVEIDRLAIHLEHPIKELGVFEVLVKLHPKVETTLKIWVVEE
jgi:large subunit ribosomal protein L9